MARTNTIQVLHSPLDVVPNTTLSGSVGAIDGPLAKGELAWVDHGTVDGSDNGANGKLYIGDATAGGAVQRHIGGIGTGVAPAAGSTLTGTSLKSTIVTSSLTSVGALASGSLAAGFGAIDCAAITATGDTHTFDSTATTDPLFHIKNTTNDATGPRLRLENDRGANNGTDGDDCGTIEFYGTDGASAQTAFGSILCEVSESDDGDEAGKMSFFVAESDSTTTALAAGIIIEGEHATNGEVDVTIGGGSGSTTTINGDLTVSGTTTTVNSTAVSIADVNLTLANGAADSSAADGAGITIDGADATLLYTHSGTKWAMNKPLAVTGVMTGSSTITAAGRLITDDTTEAASTTDGSLQTDGGLSVAKSAVIGDDLDLLSDSAILSMGLGSDFTMTHDGTTGVTLAANPITITSGGAATWSTSSGALTIDSAAALVIDTDGTDNISLGTEAAAKTITVGADESTKVDVNAIAIELDATTTVTLDSAGTAAGAIDINSAGGIDIDAVKAISLNTTGTAGDIEIHSAHTAGVAVLIDANAAAGSILDIDAGVMDVDVQAGFTLDATGVSIDSDAASNLTTSVGALTITSAAAATWSTAAGALVIDGAAGLTLDSDGTDAVNLGTEGVAKTITIGADESTLVDVNALVITLDSGGDINLSAANDVNIPSAVGLTFGNDGEKIEGDGTDLAINSSGVLTLTSTGDFVVASSGIDIASGVITNATLAGGTF